MDEKVYRPIVKDGDHLAKSKTNPDRVRGLTFDDNNKNPDIIEWEEVDVDELRRDSDNPVVYERDEVQLTPEQEQMAREVGEAVAQFIVTGSILLYQEVISPWWKERAWPWLKKKGKEWKDSHDSAKERSASSKPSYNNSTTDYSELSSQIDSAFENFYLDMSSEEANEHLMKLLYHMLGVVNEIRIISNARIKNESLSEEQCLEQLKAAEAFLTQRVAKGIDSLLLDSKLKLDLDTSRQLYTLTGGGIWNNGEYIRVSPVRICEALKAFDVIEQ